MAATRAFLNCRQRVTDELPNADYRTCSHGCPRPRLAGRFQVSERLRECAAKLREHLRGPAASHWLKDNHSLLQSHIADLRHTLRPSFLQKLHRPARQPRIYRIVTGWLANEPGVIDNDVLLPFAEVLRETESLDIEELWAFAPMLKFAIVERLCANLDSERLVAGCVRTLWALEAISWKTFVETASRTEAALRQDPGRRLLSAWTWPLAIDIAWS